MKSKRNKPKIGRFDHAPCGARPFGMNFRSIPPNKDERTYFNEGMVGRAVYQKRDGAVFSAVSVETHPARVLICHDQKGKEHRSTRSEFTFTPFQ